VESSHVPNAKEPEKRAMDCPVRAAEVKDSIKMNNNTLAQIRKSLLKKQEALVKSQARKEAFLLPKKQITHDIEEARIIWRNTMEQLPNHEFD
jgi:hypothetical protein